MTTDPQGVAPSSYHKSQRPREAVLIVGHGDGWVEAYAEKHVDVRIVIAPWATTADGEIAAEEYIEANLPWRYRDLYFPGLLRCTGQARIILPSDIAQRDYELELLRSIERAGEILRGTSGESEVVSCLI